MALLAGQLRSLVCILWVHAATPLDLDPALHWGGSQTIFSFTCRLDLWVFGDFCLILPKTGLANANDHRSEQVLPCSEGGRVRVMGRSGDHGKLEDMCLYEGPVPLHTC